MHTRNRHRAAVLALAAACLLGSAVQPGAAATTAHAPARAPAPAPSPLHWGACPPPAAGPGTAPVHRDPRQRCAKVSVPLDYQRPNGPHLGIEISRILSGARHARSLMTGQGGPGGSGIDLPSSEESALPGQVTASTDLYGLDYRGIGASAPLDCGIAPADRAEATGIPYPAPDGGIAANIGVARRTAAACARDAGAEIRYVNTANIARDIDSVRRALGLRTLSYTGTSYGSYVGEVYATLFPRTAGRVLLNSVVPPGGVEEAITNKGEGVADAFGPFATWVAARDSTYHLGAAATGIRATVLALARRLNGAPLPFPDGDGRLTGNLLLEAQEVLLEQQSYYPVLAGLLADARAGAIPPGAGSALPVGSELPDNFVSAQDAIICNDTAWPRDMAHYRAAVARSARRYPLTAGSPANVWACAFWDTPTSDRAPRPDDRGPADVQLVQNTADPSTPLSDARETLHAFGRRAGLVTVDAAGHGVDTSSGCVADVVTRFLTGAASPRSGHCPAGD
ncbi:alpha/beta hydrolase [Streptomyces sp. 8L]|uniref:alpha/beta hydrolase n=1 Tax=Streptomyces sp. 8L TaxID=2877242 RepID=UPI001CD5CEAE|nr:alpha/beta hydrolase [Streptomyces sp. 8L]MCA1221823.1 alpha/beta hydrolase [Streptomyces sp. 8L]